MEFLKEAKAGLGKEFAPLFDRAIRHYQVAAPNLGSMSEMFPHDIVTGAVPMGQGDAKKREAAVRYLRAAKDAEVEGLKALAEIVGKL